MAPLQVPNGSFSQFGPIWRPMALPYGHSGPGKWSQHITLDVPSPDPTLIHTDPPVCSRQGGVWPQKDHLWLFWAVFGHKMGQNGSKWLDQEWLPLDHDQTQPHWAYSIIGFHKIATSLSPLTHCGEPLGTTLRKTPFQMIARIYWIFLLREAFLWHGLIHPHAGAYM